MAQETKPDEYYPLRWKIADAVEDIFLLHRSKAIGVIALIGLAFILVGFLLLGWGGATSQTDTAAPSTDASSTDNNDTPGAGDDSDAADTATTAPTTVAPTTAAPTTAPSTTEAPATTAPTTAAPTTAAPSARQATPEQVASTDAGAVITMTPTAVTLSGGLPTDADADEIVDVVEATFTGLATQDELVTDEGFADSDVIVFRLSAPDLFGYNSDNLNPDYFALIDQLATAMVDAGTWRVEVSGHTDDSGPADGNQRLSERRAAAAAQRLVGQGVSSAQVTSIGRGEDQPIADNGSEAGRLANRRVEFAITR